jgi:hypothetical protein
MDCEGSEWEILSNKEVFQNVKFITMEYHLGKNSLDHSRIKNVLEEIGFKLISRIDYLSKANYGIAVAYNEKLLFNI